MCENLSASLRQYCAMADSPGDDGEEALRILNLVVNVFIDGLLCLLGYVGNILAIYVLSRDRARNSNTLFMQVLAGYDILFLTHTMLYTVLRSVYLTTGHLKGYHRISPYIVAFDLPFGWIAQTGTIWFTTILAADRYVAISRPFKALTLCTLQNAKRVTIGLSISALLFNVPRFFYYFKVALHSNNNSTFIAHVKIELPGFDADLYRYIYHIGLTFIFLYIVPLTSLSILNAKLIKTLRVARRARKHISINRRSSLTKQNTTVTLNLVIVITKFIVCETPDFISSMMGAIPLTAYHSEYKMFNTIKEMLLVFNSAVNFYIYCKFNTRFRENLGRSFSCCQKCNLEVNGRTNAASVASTLNVSLSTLSLAIAGFRQGPAETSKLSADGSKTADSNASHDNGGDDVSSYPSKEFLDEKIEGKKSKRLRIDSVLSNLTESTAADSEGEDTLQRTQRLYHRQNNYMDFYAENQDGMGHSGCEVITTADYHYCPPKDPQTSSGEKTDADGGKRGVQVQDCPAEGKVSSLQNEQTCCDLQDDICDGEKENVCVSNVDQTATIAEDLTEHYSHTPPVVSSRDKPENHRQDAGLSCIIPCHSAADGGGFVTLTNENTIPDEQNIHCVLQPLEETARGSLDHSPKVIIPTPINSDDTACKWLSDTPGMAGKGVTSRTGFTSSTGAVDKDDHVEQTDQVTLSSTLIQNSEEYFV